MKTKITILFVLCTDLYLNAQEIEDRLKKVEIKLDSITKKEDKSKSNTNLKTKVLTLDLPQPKSETLISNDSLDKRLVFWNKEPLQF